MRRLECKKISKDSSEKILRVIIKTTKTPLYIHGSNSILTHTIPSRRLAWDKIGELLGKCGMQLLARRTSLTFIFVAFKLYSPHSHPSPLDQPKATSMINLVPIAIGCRLRLIEILRVRNPGKVRCHHEVQNTLVYCRIEAHRNWNWRTRGQQEIWVCSWE
jgi:hypothetical protein